MEAKGGVDGDEEEYREISEGKNCTKDVTTLEVQQTDTCPNEPMRMIGLKKHTYLVITCKHVASRRMGRHSGQWEAAKTRDPRRRQRP